MTEGNLDANTAATLALLADTSRAGNRGGYFGGGEGGGDGIMYPGNSTLAAGAHADGTAVKTAVDCNARASAASLDRISDQNEETRRLSSFDNIRDSQFQAELRNSDRLRDLEREIAANARVAAQCCCDAQIEALKCCCETQKLVTAEAATTRELINQNTIRTAIDANNVSSTVGQINAAAAQNTAALIAAIQGLNNHHHR